MSMLFKRIKDWATIITAFRTGDVIPVDGPSGTAKMSKDDLLRETAEDSNSKLVPAYIPNYTYKANALCEYNGVVYSAKEDFTSEPEFTPTSWDVSNINNSLKALSCSVLPWFEGNRQVYIEERPGTIDGSIYVYFDLLSITYEGFTQYVGKGYSPAYGGLATTTSPAGRTSCIEIQNGKTLVWDTIGNKLRLVQNGWIRPNQVVLITCRYGTACGGQLLPFKTSRYDKYSQTYASSAWLVSSYIELSFPLTAATGKIWIKGNAISRRLDGVVGAYNKNFGDFGITLETSPDGIEDCLPLDTLECLVFNYATNDLEIVTRDNVKEEHQVLLANVEGFAVSNDMASALGLYTFELKKENLLGQLNLSSMNDFATLYAAHPGCDTQFVFSDPHTMSLDNKFDISPNEKLFKFLMRITDSWDFDSVVCLGDWLNRGDSTANAISKLSWLSKNLNKIFKNYRMVFGNHDDNYVNNYNNRLSSDIINNIMFGGKGRWYSYSTDSCDYFVLDSGNNDHNLMTEYDRWTQIDWLANKLLQSTKSNAVIQMHLYSDGYQSPADFVSGITPFATTLQTLFAAVNGRTTVTLNGITYDFSAAVVKVRLIMTGHTHYDLVYTGSTVPVYVITSATAASGGVLGTTYSADACLFDFANLKLYTKRFGLGSDREIDLAN